MTIENNSDKTQNLWMGTHINVFSQDGIKYEDRSMYLDDDYPNDWLIDIRSGAVYDTYFIVEYSGDGEYIIEIGKHIYSNMTELFVEIVR